MHEDVLAVSTRTRGAEHPATLIIACDVAGALVDVGKYDKAATL